MATKAKAKKGPGKTGKKPKKKVGLTLGIGVISTIRVPQPLRAAFKRGLNDNGVTIKVEHALSYKRAALKRKIDQFNADKSIGLIVTVGGLIAFQAANALATKPFISLLGVTPASVGAKCFGGVTLQSFASNPGRIAHLRNKGFSESQIGLFQNPNSAMAQAEAAAWTGAKPPILGGVDSSRDNDPNAFASDFNSLPAAITALVLSGDPFFQDSKDDLVRAANGSGRYMCYPFQDYGDGSPAPTAGRATLFGPELTDPYTLLGERAGKVLHSGAKLVPLFASVPDIIKDL
jgi:hypothetical protein